MAGVWPEPGLVDQRLRVFNPETDSEGLGFHENTGLVHHLEGVASTVAERQNDLICLDVLTRGQFYTTNVAVFNVQASNPALEVNFAAQFDNFGAHTLDHAD